MSYVLPLIILPALFLFALIFIFASSVTAIANQEYLLNCPYPLQEGTVSNANIVDNRLTYNVTYSGAVNATGAFFNCYLNAGNFQSAQIIAKTYGATAFNVIPYGYYAYLADYVGVFFGKAQPLLTIVAVTLNAPAQVTGLALFTLIEVMLAMMIAFGLFIAIRG